MSIVFQNTIVKKRDFYAWFIQAFKDAGWIDVSSNPATDFQMLMSTGESGDKEMYMNFKESDANGVFSTSASTNINIRFPYSYVPNLTQGVAGTLKRPSANWWRCEMIGSVSISLDTPMSVWYHVNKNRGVFLLEGNNGYNNTPNFYLFGKPDNELRGETKYSGPILLYNCCWNTNGGVLANHNAVVASNDSYLISSGDFYQSIYLNDYPGPLATTGKKFCSDIVIGDANGFRYKINDGILVTDAINVPFTNTYMINGNKYKFFNTSPAYGWGNSLNGYCVGIRIE